MASAPADISHDRDPVPALTSGRQDEVLSIGQHVVLREDAAPLRMSLQEGLAAEYGKIRAETELHGDELVLIPAEQLAPIPAPDRKFAGGGGAAASLA
jgi:hypothetical protein